MDLPMGKSVGSAKISGSIWVCYSGRKEISRLASQFTRQAEICGGRLNIQKEGFEGYFDWERSLSIGPICTAMFLLLSLLDTTSAGR